MAKVRTKPHAANNVAQIDATIAAELSASVAPFAPTLGATATTSVAPAVHLPPLPVFSQPLGAKPSASPTTAPAGGVTPAVSVAAPEAVVMAPSTAPRAEISRNIDFPLFGAADDPEPSAAPQSETVDTPELAQLRADLAARDAQIAEYQAALAATPVQIGELEHLEEPVALEMRSRIVEPLINEALRRQAAEYDKRFAKFEARAAAQSLTEAQRSENNKQRALSELNKAIFAQHPDYSEISATDGFMRALTQKIPLTERTFGDEIKAAYRGANAEQFNRLVSHIKSNYLAAAAPAIVLGAGGGAPDLSPVQESILPPVITRAEMDIARLQMQQGRLGRKEFAEKVRQFEAQT